jgi:hypothetical protein
VHFRSLSAELEIIYLNQPGHSPGPGMSAYRKMTHDPVAKFVVSKTEEEYDADARGPNLKFHMKSLVYDARKIL